MVYDYFNRPAKKIMPDGGPSMTQEHFAEECDIKNILKKYNRTGILKTNRMRPMYGDYSQITGYQEALELVRESQDRFKKLPAPLRDRFKNNPGALIVFLNDPKNKDEAARLGLIPKPVPEYIPTPPEPEPKPA